MEKQDDRLKQQTAEKKEQTGRCIVVAAGDLTVGEIDRTGEEFVIAVDGGLSYCGILGLEPDLIIGDFDSLSEKEREAVEQLKLQIPERIIQLKREKDDTDLYAALKIGLEKGYRDFRIYGGTGGRFDHTLANIQCLLYLKNRGAAGYLIDGTGMMFVIQNEAVHLNRSLEGTLSLFSLDREALGVFIENMKYTLKDYRMTNDFPIGISNEFIGKEAVIGVEKGALVCMIQYAL